MKKFNVLEKIVDKELRTFAEILLLSGYKIITMNYCVSRLGVSGLTHFTFTKDEKDDRGFTGFGYVQRDLGGYKFSSEYVPVNGSGNGTGAGYGLHPLTIESAENAMWATVGNYHRTPIQWYKDLDHYSKIKERGDSWVMLIQDELDIAIVQKVFPIEDRKDFFKYVIMDNGAIHRDFEDKEMYFDSEERATEVCDSLNKVRELNKEFINN